MGISMDSLCTNVNCATKILMEKIVSMSTCISSMGINNLICILDIKDPTTLVSEYLEKRPDYGPRAYECKVCGKINSDNSSARKHIENIHFPGMFTYACKYCGKTFNARNN